MSNPFSKFLSKEDFLHKGVIDYLRLKFPHAVVCHPPNEGRRTAFERYKAKLLGISSGVPDLLIFSPMNSYNGLAIELKIKPNKMTPSQLEWHAKLLQCRWMCACIYTLDDAIILIDEYFKKPKQHGTTTLN